MLLEFVHNYLLPILAIGVGVFALFMMAAVSTFVGMLVWAELKHLRRD